MVTGQDLSFGQRLRRERESRYWTQKHLSEKIVGDESAVPSINRWENDRTRPRSDTLARLTDVFGKPHERWGVGRLLHRHIPFLRNPYFTGRDSTFLRLYRILAADNTRDASQSCAISGLGGIGRHKQLLSMLIVMPTNMKLCCGCRPIPVRYWLRILLGSL